MVAMHLPRGMGVSRYEPTQSRTIAPQVKENASNMTSKTLIKQSPIPKKKEKIPAQ
jgi:hypothetical protein